jgi:hypothetical protein
LYRIFSIAAIFTLAATRPLADDSTVYYAKYENIIRTNYTQDNEAVTCIINKAKADRRGEKFVGDLSNEQDVEHDVEMHRTNIKNCIKENTKKLDVNPSELIQMKPIESRTLFAVVGVFMFIVVIVLAIYDLQRI